MKEVAIAILHEVLANQTSPPRLLMQLRDPIPGIAYPGYWGFFGGHLDLGESPEACLRRELWEEIRYQAHKMSYFGNYGDETVHRHVFTVPLHVRLSELALQEGWDMALLSWEELKTGACYSSKAKQVRPIGGPHLQAISDFFTKNV